MSERRRRPKVSFAACTKKCVFFIFLNLHFGFYKKKMVCSWDAVVNIEHFDKLHTIHKSRETCSTTFCNSLEMEVTSKWVTLCIYPLCDYCDFTLPFVRRQSAMPKPDPTHLKGGKHTSRKFPATSQLSIKPDESSSQENVNRIITFGSMPSYR